MKKTFTVIIPCLLTAAAVARHGLRSMPLPPTATTSMRCPCRSKSPRWRRDRQGSRGWVSNSSSAAPHTSLARDRHATVPRSGHQRRTSARADVARRKANHDAAVAGPTKEERAIARSRQVSRVSLRLRFSNDISEKPSCAPPRRRHRQRGRREVGDNVHPVSPCFASQRRQAVANRFNAREDFSAISRSGRRSRSPACRRLPDTPPSSPISAARNPPPPPTPPPPPLRPGRPQPPFGYHDRSTLRCSAPQAM